ncbi:hypothetical protein VNI00_001509 [Paramarasmius palmivorus]|uniref:Uncharacterized protein n=1 Tax=Paramarasmius palmivorus TaxID=297713 RepID=A0AAW0E1G1_9AGAR
MMVEQNRERDAQAYAETLFLFASMTSDGGQTLAALREIVRHRSFSELCHLKVEDNKKILAPQADNGYLSEHDLVQTAEFMGVCGTLPVVPLVNSIAIGMTVAAVSTRLRIPRTLLGRSTLTASTTAGSYIVSNTEEANDRRRDLLFPRFWKSLEDPSGVLLALQTITNRYPTFEPSTSSPGQFLDAPAPSPVFVDEHAPSSMPVAKSQTAPTPAPQAHSRWDEIRSKNAKQATPSAWDALRETHQRSQIQSKEGTSKGTEVPAPQDDRAKAQAEFDAMVERERNMK